MTDASTQVRVRFVTSHEEYRISDAPFVIPARLGRAGLSAVVNQLLALEEAVGFDFQIGEHLLRSPLYKFILLHRLSTEDTITVHYFVASRTESAGQSEEQPAWISCINTSTSLSIAGCYDGKLRIFDRTSLAVLQEVAAHEEPINAVAVWDNGEGNALIASASKDNTVGVWSTGGVQLARLVGHGSAVESVTHWRSHAGTQTLLSADWAGSILAWEVTAAAANADTEEKKSKKRKTSSSTSSEAFTPSEVRPLFSIKAHASSVSALHASAAEGKGYSSSWDHSVKVWDLSRQDAVFTINTSKVVTDMDLRCNSHGGGDAGADSWHAIATSHPDGRVRLWDERRKESSGSAVAVLGSSAVWIAQVSNSPSGLCMR